MRARKAVRRALQTQVDGKGFSFVEVISACPTGWKMAPPDAVQWVEKTMLPVFPLGVYRDGRPKSTPVAEEHARKTQAPRPQPQQAEPAAQIRPGALARGEIEPVALKISGFGGQGVLFAGVALAEAGMREGLQVSWIPSYGPEMRGGTAHCHVRLSAEGIASPLINRPSTVIAFNEPSVDKFASEVLPGGLMMLNSSMVKKAPDRTDIKVVWVPATEAANDLGNPKVGNMVMLGAFLQETQALNPDSILSALVEHGLRADLVKVNRVALQVGRGLIAHNSATD
jgi:Pyruvate/2-oxoacid:ferredoxin oxidoreductase gamma subunit